ncbi:hypothetical protein [Singulisphaera sp. PoT]|uniref:hypothetical protein n=1 Tax=Singulisphaera sp. PoT TaxID=3411797 RepID=UPI003BF56EA5
MPPNATFNPYPTPLDGDAVPIVVFLYGRDTGQFIALPNIVCLGIDRHEGPDPPTARFQYLFDDSNPNSPYPTQFQQVWPILAQGPYVIQNDDELVVAGYTSSGFPRIIFDGFAQIPQIDINRDSQIVSFIASGVAIRCFDNPIGGAVYRNAEDPDSTDKKDMIETDLPTRFNPDGKPNGTPNGKDINNGQKDSFPLFLDPYIDRTPDPRGEWTLGAMSRYLLACWNDQKFVKNPDFRALDSLLLARKPKKGNFYDPATPSTYTAEPIVIRDFDATNLTWPVALNSQLQYHNFAMCWQLSQGEDNVPATTMKIYRKDAAAAVAPKKLYLQKPGITVVLDPGKSNVQELSMSRDLNKVANEYYIETDPKEYECGIVLAPGFKIAAGDESDANRKKYLSSALTNASGDDRAKYRDYVGDEAGDGHWDYDTNAWVTKTALDLDDVLGEPEDAGDGSGKKLPQYVHRLRKPEGTLISKDSDGQPLKAVLMVSRDYAGDCPAVWDGTGTWQTVDGGWKLMDDRIGIRCTAADPEDWSIGKPDPGITAQNSGTSLRGVTSQSNPSGSDQNTKRFYLMLVSRIPGDLMMISNAEKREASPTDFKVMRRIDCKDHFKFLTVDESSPYNKKKKPVVAQDDTKKADAHAEALRAAHEFPPLAGTATIPWLTNSYDIGDRLELIDGRGASFQTNLGTNQGEAPMYPYIIGISYNFDGGRQETRISFSDRLPEVERA